METRLKINLNEIRGYFASFLPITHEINQGEVVKIDGVNGSGKSTLLKIIAGITPNYTGDLLINGHNLRYNLLEYKSNLQFIGSQDGLYADLTAKDNVSLFSKLWSGIDNGAAGIHFFKIKNHTNDKIFNLSSGNKRKVALARLVACPALIWVIDEMDAYLDDQSCLRLKGLINDRVSQGGTVFFSSQRNVFDDIATSKINLKIDETL